MPQFEHFPYPCRYNTLRLLGYDYNSIFRLCAITLVTEARRPVFADMQLAKSVIASLLSDETLEHMRLRAFTLMPNHLHFLAGVREPELYLPNLIGQFKSYSTQLYWKRSHEVLKVHHVSFTFDMRNQGRCQTVATLDISLNRLASHTATGSR